MADDIVVRSDKNGGKVHLSADRVYDLNNDKTQDEINGQIVHPNLLDNWYFGNPVNQRGQSSYSNSGYTIDRWKTNASLTVNGGSLSVGSVGTSGRRGIFEILENPDQLVGKTVTLSCYAKKTAGTGFMLWHGVGTPAITATSDTFSNTGFSVCSFTFVWPADDTTAGVSVYNDSASSFEIQALKLELGSTQTLCHNEGTDANPVWVLNEIPNYDEQLLRCRSSKADPADTYANNPAVHSSELAIVENTDVATHAIAKGQYVVWKGQLYTAKSAISVNVGLSLTNLEACSSGGLNDLKNTLTVDDRILLKAYGAISSGDFNSFSTFPINTVIRCAGTSFTNAPSGSTFYGTVETICGDRTTAPVYAIQKAYQISNGEIYRIYKRSYADGTWYNWNCIFGVIETTTISNIVNAESGVTITAATFEQYGRVAQIYFTLKTSSNLSGDNVLCRLVSGKRPITQIGVFSPMVGDYEVHFGSSGKLYFHGNLTANIVYIFYTTYIIA